MNLNTQILDSKILTDDLLLKATKEKVQSERRLTVEVIELMQEVYSRKLHLRSGYGSLHEYCVKELKYSDSAAYRRIKAMKLTAEVPEIKKSIESGLLNLSSASQLQKAFETKALEKKAISLELKKAIIARVENQPRREVEKILVQICPETIKQLEKVTRLNTHQVKIEFVIDEELLEKIERLKSLTSHKNKSLRHLLADLVDEALIKKDPALRPAKPRYERAKPQDSDVKHKSYPPPAIPHNPSPALGQSVNIIDGKTSRHIPSTVRQEVWMRDKGRCTYFDSKSQRQCNSNHRVQFEHIEPYSFGGRNTVENLRLLCANHNRLMTERFSDWKQKQ